jgi:probable phosphoglycerate mutase
MAFARVVAMSVRLWLVRHGATDWGDAGRFLGWSDVPLNALGRRQAGRLGERLAGERFSSVWSSDLRRASDTARLAVGGATPDRRLRELDFGEMEGRRWEECSIETQEGLIAFDGFRAPGGESVAELRNRVLAFAGDLRSGDHLLFTHAGVIRILLREADRDRHVPPGTLEQVAL